jgi:hypothetical protein
MARTSKLRHEGDRLTDLINIGVLTKQFPLGVIREVLEETGRSSRRQRDLPAHVMVYYVIAMALYRSEGMREVLRVLLEGLSIVLGVGIGLEPAGKSGISQARKRLGEKPVQRLYEQSVRPIATEQTKGAFYRGWHVVAMDGSTAEAPDTPANREAFGRPASPSGGESAFPLIRIVGLVEVGTRVLFGAVLGSYATGEVTLARSMVTHLRPGMLCLADRYFPGYPLWKQAVETGADLVWRVRQVIGFSEVERLPDGSWLSWFRPPRRRKGEPKQEPIPVRVIDYQVEGPERKEETIRIITSILDWEAAPAHELAALYHERWEFETALDELKTHMRGARTVLRSQTPELVRQECYGLLLAHFALRGLMHEAALSAGRDPDRISFVHTIRVVRRTLPRFAALPPSGLARPARRDTLPDPAGGRGVPAAAPVEAGGQAKAEQVRLKTANRQEQNRPSGTSGST